MATHTKERRIFAQGLAATVTRDTDRINTPLVLRHGLDDYHLSQLLQNMQLFVGHTGASILTRSSVNDSNTLTTKAHVERLERENAVLEARLELLKNQLAAAKEAQRIMTTPTSPAPQEIEWMSLPEAAKKHHVSYPTMWRAHNDGRLTTKVIGGQERDHLVCDPSTFRRKTRGKKSS